MSFRRKIIKTIFSPRRAELRRVLADPLTAQQKQLQWLLERGSRTEIGRQFGMGSIKSIEQFMTRVETFDYDAYSPYIDRARRGERDVVWNGEVKWFARSSGTTDRSKYIPVTSDGLLRAHTQGTRDVAAIVSSLFPDTRAYDGKLLTLGGSRRVEREGERALTGDLSAILIENTRSVSGWFRTPSRDVALIADFEEKVETICRQTTKQNVTCFAGVPSWNLMLMQKVLEYTGKESLCEVWPNLELFVHGGVGFAPYAEHYKRTIPSERMRYINTYNASEGFFSIADGSEQEDMLLMVDYGTFYEFDNGHEIVPLEGVKVGEVYELIITSCNGLWRYRIGDTVTFTSTKPYRIKIAGRTKQFINVFGEELMVANAELALSYACRETAADVSEYTVAPVYMTNQEKGRHQWIIEFAKEPNDIARFAELLDAELQRLNSDYEAKRHSTLSAPQIDVVEKGTFFGWLASQGKIGGQNKVPRLANTRQYADSLEAYIASKGCNSNK